MTGTPPPLRLVHRKRRKRTDPNTMVPVRLTAEAFRALEAKATAAGVSVQQAFKACLEWAQSPEGLEALRLAILRGDPPFNRGKKAR